ncbi:hypothetical protein T12_9151 [Trichinella patagoniensis]|uniref:Uncharacterized protein n=1 Tax=Trichinella patagoniensis TaxID=990121 RepID=A0A0V1A3P2_9BILA|nr:hypothetical protein T12_9151 [Trichinella patagoniensis]
MKIAKLNTRSNMRKIEFNILDITVKRENKGVVCACRWSTDPVQPVSIGLDARYCCTLTLPVYVVKNTSVPG